MKLYERKHLHMRKQERFAFAEWAVYLGPTPKQNFTSLYPQRKVM